LTPLPTIGVAVMACLNPPFGYRSSVGAGKTPCGICHTKAAVVSADVDGAFTVKLADVWGAEVVGLDAAGAGVPFGSTGHGIPSSSSSWSWSCFTRFALWTLVDTLGFAWPSRCAGSGSVLRNALRVHRQQRPTRGELRSRPDDQQC
jgi:hypothetical protein